MKARKLLFFMAISFPFWLYRTSVILVLCTDPSYALVQAEKVVVDSQRVAQTKQILKEALSVARTCNDRTERAQSLLIVAPFLENFGIEEANGAIEEAATLVPKLPERSSLWKPKNLLFRDPNEVVSESYIRKAELTFQLVQVLAYKSPPRALEFALSLKDYHARALGIEMSLQSWPRTETETVISRIRALADSSQKVKIYLSDLAALASGAMFHDIGLARELSKRVIESMVLEKDAYFKKSYQVVLSGGGIIISITALWTYEKACAVLAIADLEEAKRFLMKLKASPAENTANLIAFARGVTVVNTELAWEALLAISNDDKDVLVTKAELLRLIVPSLPSQLKAEAHQYILEFLRSLPEPWKLKFRMSFGGVVREELRRLAIMSDAIVSLGSINPDTALAQIQNIAFSEYLDEKHILDSKSTYKLLPQSMSGLNPESGEDKDEFTRTFFKNLVKLDLALSQLNSQFSLAILDSFKNDFWIGLAYTALRGGLNKISGIDSETEPNPEGFKTRLANLLEQVKEKWPLAAIKIEEPATKQYRFIKVAELFDRAAVAIFVNNEDSRKDWLNYLPFALVKAGRVLYTTDSSAASNAIAKAMNWIIQMPTPAREWALSWNIVILSKLQFPQLSLFKDEASKLAGALVSHKPWEHAVALLVNQIAIFNPEVALKIARQEENKVDRVQALVAVVAGINNILLN